MTITTTLDYLVSDVRLRIGDMTVPYRYISSWVVSALNAALKLSYRYLRNKYLIDTDGNVSRNSLSTLFSTDVTSEANVIEPQDEPILVILSAIVILQGSLESAAWNTGSWKDAEISYSNIAGGDLKKTNLENLWAELDRQIVAPTKRLAKTDKQSLPGFINNAYEREGDL